MPTIQEIAHTLKCDLQSSSPNFVIQSVSQLSDGKDGSLTFCSKVEKERIETVKKTGASAIIVSTQWKDNPEIVSLKSKHFIFSPNPRLSFIRTVRGFFLPEQKPIIHPTAVIDPTAKIEKDVSIGAHSVIGKNVVIGEGSILYSGVHIYHDVKIGKKVIINSGTVIGADGFGHERNEKGEWESFPHIGGVVIEDLVEIGSNTSIDRGTLGNTIIGEGARIDNLVHIAHNVKVGKHSAVIAHAMIAGSCVIGDYVWVAPCAATKESTKIGNEAMIGLGAVVTKEVPEKTIVAGNPARELSRFKTLLKAMDDLAK